MTSTGSEDRDPKAHIGRRRLARRMQGTKARRIRRAPSTKRRRPHIAAAKHDDVEEKDQHHTPPLRRHLRLQDTAGWKPNYTVHRSGVPPPICRRHGGRRAEEPADRRRTGRGSSDSPLSTVHKRGERERVAR